MKKRLLMILSVLIACSISAFAYLNWNKSIIDQERAPLKIKENYLINTGVEKADLELFYQVRNRWSTMTKDDIKKVRSIVDIFQYDGIYNREDYSNITISVLHNDNDVRDVEKSEMGQTEELNAAQLELLNSCDYSTNLRISTLSKRTTIISGEVAHDSILRYITIVPEHEAEFKGGFDAVVDYVKEGIKEKTAIITRDQLQPGKVFFTVTEKGAIADVNIVETSGFPSIDEALKKIIMDMPQQWTPATNSKGEKVSQEFVFFFGLEGC